MRALIQPLQMGGPALANRIVMSPMRQDSAVEGMAQPWRLIHIGG